jgi:hypothetical protein
MSTLSAVWKRVVGDTKPRGPREASPPAADRFLLLAQLGGSSFELVTFPERESMRAYASSHFVNPQYEGIVALELIDSWPAARGDEMPDGGAEAVAIIRDAVRPDIVQLYSFVDMAAAQSFVGETAGRGLDPGVVLLHWASRVPLDAPVEVEAAVSPARTGLPYRTPGVPGSASSRVQRRPLRSSFAGGTTKAEAPPAGRPAPDSVWRGLSARMLAASLFKEEIFRDLEQDRLASRRAALIVCLGSLALGIGFLGDGLASVLWHVAGGVTGWAAFAAAVYLAGTSILGAPPARHIHYFRVAGLASSPAVIFALGIVPVYGPLFVLAVSVWMTAATAVALTPALELDRGNAVIAAATGWVVYFAVAIVLPAMLSS